MEFTEVRQYRRLVVGLIALLVLAAGTIGLLAGVYYGQRSHLDDLRKELRYEDSVAQRIEAVYRVRPEEARTAVRVAFAEARRHRFDPLLVLAVIGAESFFDPLAVSYRGAIGLMQVRGIWAVEFGFPWKHLYDAETNIRTGVAVLALYRADAPFHYLPAFNRGITRVNDLLRAGRDPENGYTALVMSHYRLLRG